MKYDKLSIFLLVVFAIIVFFAIRKYRFQTTEGFIVDDDFDSCYARSENSCIDSPNCGWDEYNNVCLPSNNWFSPWLNGAWSDFYPFGDWNTGSYWTNWRWPNRWNNRWNNRWHNGNRWNHGNWRNRGNWGNWGNHGGAWNRGGNIGTRVRGTSGPMGTRISTGGMQRGGGTFIRSGGSRMGGSRMGGGGSRMGGGMRSGGGGMRSGGRSGGGGRR